MDHIEYFRGQTEGTLLNRSVTTPHSFTSHPRHKSLEKCLILSSKNLRINCSNGIAVSVTPALLIPGVIPAEDTSLKKGTNHYSQSTKVTASLVPSTCQAAVTLLAAVVNLNTQDFLKISYMKCCNEDYCLHSVAFWGFYYELLL